MKQKIDAAEYQADDEGSGDTQSRRLLRSGSPVPHVQPFEQPSGSGSFEAVGRLQSRIKSMKTRIGQTRDSIVLRVGNRSQTLIISMTELLRH